MQRGVALTSGVHFATVIHAGLYYAANSLKARLCVSGKHQLYEYCRAKGVPHARLGKLLVAPRRAQAGALAALQAKAEANGVDDLQQVTPAQITELEPGVRAEGGALVSPSSGVVDVKALMSAFAADAVASGRATLLRDARVLAGERDGGHWKLTCENGKQVNAIAVVNAAGLCAQEVSSRLSVPQFAIPTLFYARGCYFEWAFAGPLPFSRLVYPLPPTHGAGLGIHATLDVARSRLLFGPDVTYIPTLSYDADLAASVPAFEAAIRDYFPSLPAGALKYAYAGVRPKLVGLGQPAADFAIISHGNGLVALYGIESPGLTACMALADTVLTALQTA